MMCFRHVLFLPAATDYWSFYSTGGVRWYVATCLRIRSTGFYPSWEDDRPNRHFIRLASRQVCPVCCLSVMFRHSKYNEECVVLGCSVPARWCLLVNCSVAL